MTDEELHFKAVAKMKAKLFHRFSPEDYGIILGSEVILPLIRPKLIDSKPSLGGLRYRINHKEIVRIEIAHRELDRFIIFAFVKQLSSEITKYAADTTFRELDQRLYGILKL